ncbi:hypothetical protein LINGRAHAP2_LOCUS24535, partial [Linum grandiflorum]
MKFMEDLKMLRWLLDLTEEKVARAYDIAAIKVMGRKAATNFGIETYHVNGIIDNISLPCGPYKDIYTNWTEIVLMHTCKVNRAHSLAYFAYDQPQPRNDAPRAEQHVVAAPDNAVGKEALEPCLYNNLDIS